MLQAIIRYLRPSPQPTKLEHPPAIYREKASFYLYLSVRPAGGLEWHELTHNQRQSFREAIVWAVQLTDFRPAAAQERV